MKKTEIILLFLIAFLVKFLLAFLPSMAIDMNVWKAWGARVVVEGPWGFYSSVVWTNHLPGFIYLLGFFTSFWNLGRTVFLSLGVKQDLIFKLPAILADIGCAWFVYRLLRKKSQKLAYISAAFYLFNPAVIFNSSIWGQYDGYLALLLLASAYLIFNKKSVYGWLTCAFSLLTKPQAIAVLPVFFLFTGKKFKNNKKIISLVLFFSTIIFLSYPFFLRTGLWQLLPVIKKMSMDYPKTTLNAYNFWYLLGNWQPDNLLFLGLTRQLWGLFIYLVVCFFVLKRICLAKSKKIPLFYLGSGLLILAFFLFATRMHERYLLPGLVFLLVSAGMYRSRFLYLSYFVFSLIHFFNLYWVYCLYQSSFLKIIWFQNFIGTFGFSFSLLSVFWFAALLVLYLYPRWLNKADSFLKKLARSCSAVFFGLSIGSNYKIKKVKRAGLLLALILAFTFLTRIINLAHPQDFVFDEVYHAFTAQEMVKGNPAAWEWWNSSPKGFSYEWTHPPLAKLFMAGGIVVSRGLGIDNDFLGWRFPAAVFGTGVVFLAYQLAKKLFLSEKIALLTAFFLSCDGLVFVLSRIGMSDIYFAFFALLAILLAMNKKWMLMGLSWGLALAVKWTGLYLALPLFLVFIYFNWKKRLAFFKWLLIICLAIFVYFLSYLPFFTSGHSLKQFSELHQQMWGYHTQLKATHNYQSPAYTWPLNMRPVWFWVEYKETFVSNIYVLGNPVIFWSGLVFLPLFFYYAVVRKRFYLLLVLVCYFVFWVPWTFSPRVMFMYHYLPAVPFLVMILAWGINYLLREFKKSTSVVILFLAVCFLSFFFFYPIWAGTPLNKEWLKFFFWLPTWK